MKKLIVDREIAISRKKLVGIYIFVASTFCLTATAYSALTYLASPLPALSKGAEGDGLTIDAVASALRSRSKPALNDPDSGVQLLIAIFKRIGNEQIAVSDTKKQLLASSNLPAGNYSRFRTIGSGQVTDELSSTNGSDKNQFNKGLSTNSSPDPALSIHPQLAKSRSEDEGNAVAAKTLPLKPTAQSTLKEAERGKVISESPYVKEFSSGRKNVQIFDDSPLIRDYRQVKAADEPAARGRVDRSLVDRKEDRKDEREVNTALNTSGANQSTSDNVAGIIRPSEQPGLFKYVREYLKDAPLPSPPAVAQGTANSYNTVPSSSSLGKNSGMTSYGAYGGGMGGAAPAGAINSNQLMQAPAPMAMPQGQLSSMMAEKKSDGYIASTGKMRRAMPSGPAKQAQNYDSGRGSPQQSGWYKSTLKYEAGEDASEIGGKDLAFSKKKNALTRIAFLPPNAVHGIPGLQLGASLAQTTAFFNTRGKISRVTIAGFLVLTLKDDQGLPLLQAYLREGNLEALRIFHPNYAPPQLGVNLGEELPTMKAKFGEPAFILEEPRSKIKAPPVMAKNYVYPISQVSFQLARQNAAATPQVMSLFVFRFL
ncbi:MAG: hypothetical protein KGS72_27160 [Cyanobacteria bacterium REEB67]|nr:hypothetical protein [Cyanobacteria bacterium REEB67]